MGDLVRSLGRAFVHETLHGLAHVVAYGVFLLVVHDANAVVSRHHLERSSRRRTVL